MRKRKILILKTTLALFFASFLFNVDAFALDCQVIFGGCMLNNNRGIRLNFDYSQVNSVFNVKLGYYKNTDPMKRIFYPITTVNITKYKISTTYPNCSYYIPYDEDPNNEFESSKMNFSDMYKLISSYDDIYLRIERANNPADYKEELFDLRLFDFSISAIDEKPKLDYVQRTCFNADRYTSVYLTSYQYNFQWIPFTNSTFTNNPYISAGWSSFSTEWLDNNQNIIPTSVISSSIHGRPTNEYTYCNVRASRMMPGMPISYTQKIRVMPYQAPAIYTEFPQKNIVGSFTAQIKCTTENDPYNISCSQTYPVINYGSNAVPGTVSGNTVTFTKNGLAAGRYEFFVFTEFKKCENRVNYVINPNGTSTIYEDTWYNKATFEIENSSSEEIKIFGLSLSENVHTLKEINIFNMAGQIVKTIPVNFEINGEKWSEFIKIDVDNLIKGAYLFSFIGTDGYPVGEAKFMKN